MPANNNKALGPPRGRGRPRKDEVVAKPFVVHRDPRIKPKNELKYAEEAIRNANNLYKRYREKFPNPLNIDAKDLEPEARAAWDYIFHTREFTTDDVNQSYVFDKCLRDADEILLAFELFTRYIREHNFVKEFKRPDGEIGVMPLIPNQSTFARWLGCSANRIGKTMRAVASDRDLQSYKNILADCLSEGAMAGVYQSSSTMFTLKNLCDWADKYEDRTVNKNEPLQVKEAEELMAKLGYNKPALTGGENAEELPSPVND